MNSALESPQRAAGHTSRLSPKPAENGFRDRYRWWVIVGVSAIIAAIPALLYSRLGEGPFSAKSSVVGYPGFANFNTLAYYNHYVAAVLVFPVVLILLAFVGSRLFRVGPPVDPASRRWFEIEDTVPARLADLRGPGRAALVASIVGFEVALLVTYDPGLTGFIIAGFAAAAFLGTLLLRQLRPGTPGRASLGTYFVISAAAVSVLGLWSFSRVTQVTVESTGAVVAYHWLPLWVAALLAGIVGAGLFAATGRVSNEQVEIWATWLVGAPIVLFAMGAGISGALANIDLFHLGEGFGGANLIVRNGYMPWRDLYFIHGLTKDVLTPSIGMYVFENSAWGSLSGRMFSAAAALIGMYVVIRYLLRGRNVVAFAIALVAGCLVLNSRLFWLVGNLLPGSRDRFLLESFMFVALGLYLRRRTWTRAVVLALLMALDLISTPESAFAILGCAVALLVYDLTHNEHKWYLNRFPAIRRVSIAGVAFMGIFAAVLVLTGSTRAFVDYYVVFASDHMLKGGFPIQWQSRLFNFEALALPVFLALAFLYCGWQLIRRRNLRDEEWVALAIAIFSAQFYVKFLARPDGHLAQSWGVALPLLIYMGYRTLDAGSVLVAEFLRSRSSAWRGDPGFVRFVRISVVGTVVFVIVASQWAFAQSRITSTRTRLAVTVEKPASEARFGYGTPPPQLASAREILDSVRGSDTRVFDFTNTPGLFHYLIDKPSRTRFYDVNMAIQLNAQELLLKELVAQPPDVIAYSGKLVGMFAWDFIDRPDGSRMVISNSVRHYLVSNWILRNYYPYAEADGHTYLLRNGIVPQRPLGQLAKLVNTIDAGACDWAYSSAFLTAAGPSRTSTLLSGTGTTYGVTENVARTNFDTMLLSPKTTWTGGIIQFASDPVTGNPIRLLTRAGTKEPLRVFVGACPQWYAPSEQVVFAGSDAASIGRVDLETTLANPAPRTP